MSTFLGPYDVAWAPPKQEAKTRQITRRRTVSTGFEQVFHHHVARVYCQLYHVTCHAYHVTCQVRHDRLLATAEVSRKSRSYAHEMERMSGPRSGIITCHMCNIM